MHMERHIKSPDFPLLDDYNHQVMSSQDDTYNCLAFAAHDVKHWWDPTNNRLYWPEGAPRGQQIENVIITWMRMGYEVCDDGALENGYEKVAFYVQNGKVQHATRQTADGKWLSKLGNQEDILHDTVEGLEGPVYGKVSAYVRKRNS